MKNSLIKDNFFLRPLTFLNTNFIRYHFFFISYFPPYSFSSLSLFFTPINFDFKKIYVKQSYILLTWFYYMSSFNSYQKKKILKFFVFPIKNKNFTYLKAPMAHKTFSKEQFKFQSYSIKITFKTSPTSFSYLNTLNESLLFVLISKTYFPVFETNLIFLKYYKFIFKTTDGSFFSIY